MNTIYFEKWLKGLEIEDHNDIYCLYRAVKEKRNEREFIFKTNESGNYTLTCNYFDLDLILTEKSRKYFLKHIEEKYAQGDMESWYEMMRLKEKND